MMNKMWRSEFCLIRSTLLLCVYAHHFHKCTRGCSVDKGFDEHDIPYDVLWLDIEHTDGKR